MQNTIARKLVVFPNDPIIEYYKKGEITARYFNPDNFFDEVHIISFAEEEVEPELVHCMGGSAKLYIYRFRKIRFLNFIGLVLDYIKICRLVKRINPNVIRGYNSNITGFVAVSVGKILKIKSIISLHINPDKDIRHHFLVDRDLLRYSIWCFIGRVIEPYVIRNASHVICVYKFILDYAINKRGKKEGISVIYNKINSAQFFAERDFGYKDIVNILVIGRLFVHKNPENIIKSIKELIVNLVIVGDGPYYNKLFNLANDLNISHKVKLIRTVPNREIHNYYKAADIFASVNEYGGISKPVIEAMNASLPIVVQKPLWEETPELIGDCSIVVDNSAKGFKDAFVALISDRALRCDLGCRAKNIADGISGKKMEKMEAEVYENTIRNSQKWESF